MINLKQNTINDIFITISDYTTGNYPKKIIFTNKQTNAIQAYPLQIDLSTNTLRFNHYQIDLIAYPLDIGQYNYQVIENDGFNTIILEEGLANVYDVNNSIPDNTYINVNTTSGQNDIFTNPNI